MQTRRYCTDVKIAPVPNSCHSFSNQSWCRVHVCVCVFMCARSLARSTQRNSDDQPTWNSKTKSIRNLHIYANPLELRGRAQNNHRSDQHIGVMRAHYTKPMQLHDCALVCVPIEQFSLLFVFLLINGFFFWSHLSLVKEKETRNTTLNVSNCCVSLSRHS